jgi:predicted DNA-binding transcriptional regulator AlpA
MNQGDFTTAINESEVARRANVSVAVIRKWRREKTGPRFLKLGRLVRYRARDVEAWLDLHAVESGRRS